MTLQRALLVSVALHGVLLLSIPQRNSISPKASDPLVLVARLVQPSTAPTQLEPEMPRPLIRPARLSRGSAPVKQPPEAVAEPQSVEQSEPVSQSVVQQASAPVAPPVAAQPDTPQFDPGAIARYRLEIISAAKKFRRYPPIARENGWQGRVEVRVSFDGAREPAVLLNRSSGYAVLDRQAVETLTKALAPLPPLLAGKAFELEFPVVFTLDE